MGNTRTSGAAGIRESGSPGPYAAVLAAVLLCVACGTPAGDASEATAGTRAAASGPAAGAAGAGHVRMIHLLREIDAEARAQNPYLGLGQVRELRRQLAALPPDVPDLRRWLFHTQLGKHELRLGNEEQSLEHYKAAYEEMDQFAEEIPLREAVRTVYELGVAYMRWAETRNCVAHHTADSCIFPIRGGGVHVEPEGARAAIHCFVQVLGSTAPDSYFWIKSRWLLNIAFMTLGEYPDGVPAGYRIEPAVFASDEEFPRFVDIAPDLGLNSFDLSGGAVASDFDGDGWLDIMVSSLDTAAQLRYFRNRGDGGFQERTNEAGLAGLVGGLNLVQADYDNDGDTDLLVLRGAWFRALGRHPNSLIRNNGDGTFTDVTFEAGLGQVHYPTQTAAWADYDNDGDLDLYVGNEEDPTLVAPGQLFRNEGDGTFVDVASQAGVENNAFAKAVVWGDYDDDLDADLFVSNMGSANRLYRNNGDGTFTDVAEQAGVTRPLVSFPTWFWDFDNDGILDLFVAAYGPRGGPDLVDVAASYLGLRHRAELAALYRGRGDGRFDDVAADYGLSRALLPMGANYGDLDNDGYPDFYIGTGYPYYEGLMPNVMYRNRGGKGFADITTSGGFGHLQKGHGVVFADLDHDGDQDVYQQMGGSYPGDAFGNVLFENPGFGRHWIKIELVGVRSNRSAVGARIRVDFVEDGRRRSVYKQVHSGGSFGCNPLRQEIGLGLATRIDRLEVRWPATGEIQELHDLAVDQRIEITEGESGFRPLPHPTL